MADDDQTPEWAKGMGQAGPNAHNEGRFQKKVRLAIEGKPLKYFCEAHFKGDPPGLYRKGTLVLSNGEVYWRKPRSKSGVVDLIKADFGEPQIDEPENVFSRVSVAVDSCEDIDRLAVEAPQMDLFDSTIQRILIWQGKREEPRRYDKDGNEVRREMPRSVRTFDVED